MTARAPKGLVLFRAPGDLRQYLDLLAAEVAGRGWSLRTYCLMTTHIHLLVGTPEANLGKGIKRIHETFVRLMHREHDGHGHLFCDRFHNRLVLTEHHEIACLRYIARNPVTAGLCPSADDWEWSAHAALAGLIKPPSFLDLPAVRATVGRSDYQALVATSDRRLLDDLAAHMPDTWIAHAVDDHHLPVPTIADMLGINITTAYRRLAAARKQRDSPSSCTPASEGTVP